MIRGYKYILKYRELLLYGLFGGLTTVINIVIYNVFTHFFMWNYLFANAFSWVAAFIFAYYTNSKYVFGYKPFFAKDSIERFTKFLNSRIFTGIIDMFLMWLLVDRLILNDSVSKIVVNVVVIILNYLMSKFLIFKGEHL